jgi:hypothetical protein
MPHFFPADKADGTMVPILNSILFRIAVLVSWLFSPMGLKFHIKIQDAIKHGIQTLIPCKIVWNPI